MARKRMFQAKKVFGRGIACLLVAGLCLGVAGCERTEKVRESIDQSANEAKQSLANAAKPASPVVYDPLTVTNKLWHGNTATRMQRGMPLPSRLEDTRGVALVAANPMPLADIANAISSQTGIPIRMTSLTTTAKGASAAAASSAASSSGANNDMSVSYEGPLSGLLDRISAHFGVSWRYDGSSITILRYETRVFVVEALPGTQDVNEGMQDDSSSSSGSSSSGSGGSSSSSSSSSQSSNTLTQNSKTTMSLKYWEELAAVLTSMVNGQGNAIVSPTMGTVTVTTTPDIMGTVSDYLSKENKRLSRQIAINVQVYSVNLGQSEDFNMAFSGFLSHLSGQLRGLSFVSGALPDPLNTTITSGSLGTLGITILKGGSDPKVTTSELFKALSAVGDASEVAQFPMTTLNNHPVSRRVGVDRAYISSYNSVTATGTGTSTSYTPVISTIHSGFSLQLTPRLLEDGRILLQYSLGLIGIEDMGQTSFDAGGDSTCTSSITNGVTTNSCGRPISLPTTDNRIFVQQSMLRSGQTLVIGGIDRNDLQQKKQGVGSPDNFLLGGSTSSTEARLMMFIAITPQVMDVGVDEERR